MRTIVFVVVAVPLIAAFIALVLKWAPNWIASSSRAAEVNASRTALLALLAGCIAVVGVIYTARTFAPNRQGHELDRQGQITERFTRAVDQLGNKDSLDVRLGGIYALERLARESPEDHGPIMEILTAFVREHASRPPAPPEITSGGVEQASVTATPSHSPEGKGAGTVRNSPTTDVQAVLTVLGRRTNGYDTDRRLDLSDTDLAGANLSEAHLAKVFLVMANLQEAFLSGANLQGAMLRGTNLQRAFLIEANLQKGFLGRADLRLASLSGANLQGAILGGASLQGATLRGANLRGAILGGANLQRAKLDNANLQRAKLDNANLESAILDNANLEGAILSGANLQGAMLRGANLQRAKLDNANLEGANLERAILRDANLEGARLRDTNLDWAYYSQDTTWPEGFDPGARPSPRVTSGQQRGGSASTQNPVGP